MRLIYLDYNATTPLAGAAREAMLPYLYDFYGHPGSSHWTGAAVAEAIEDARANVASMLNCQPQSVIFTSGGTESVNAGIRLAWQTLCKAHHDRPQIVLCNLEHDIGQHIANSLSSNRDVTKVVHAVDMQVDPLTISQAIGDRPSLLCLTLADGDTGLVQPVDQVVSKLQANGQREHTLIHVDACQATSKIEIDVDGWGVDFVSISGHKMYAAKGVGALVIRNRATEGVWQYGDWHERGIRNGMPNVPGIASMSAAASLVRLSLEKFEERCRDLLAAFHDRITECLGRAFVELLSHSNKLPNTRLYSFGDCTAEDVLSRCPNICLRTFACQEASQTGAADQPTNFRRNRLRAAGLSNSEIEKAIRISVGWNTTESEITHAAELLSEAYQQKRDTAAIFW
jgi:cysteine desulfurase